MSDASSAPKTEKPDFQDITLYDVETGEAFTFTAKEQEFYWKQGFTNVPKYTPERRKLKREQREAGKTSYKIKCKVCNKVGRVYQEPIDPKQIYCETCFNEKWQGEFVQVPEVPLPPELIRKPVDPDQSTLGVPEPDPDPSE